MRRNRDAICSLACNQKIKQLLIINVQNKIKNLPISSPTGGVRGDLTAKTLQPHHHPRLMYCLWIYSATLQQKQNMHWQYLQVRWLR